MQGKTKITLQKKTDALFDRLIRQGYTLHEQLAIVRNEYGEEWRAERKKRKRESKSTGNNQHNGGCEMIKRYECISGYFDDEEGVYDIGDNPYPILGEIQYIVDVVG